jgi:predicted RecB family nuclease
MKAQLTDVRGVGPTTASALKAQGVRTVAALAKASVDKVTAAPGFGETRAVEVIAAATALLAAAGEPKAAAKMAASLQVKKKPMATKSKIKKIKNKKKNGNKKNKKKNKNKKTKKKKK